MKGLTLTVSQLNEYVRKTLASDPILRGLCLTGEISNFKRHVSGHWYFSIKDEDAAINCAMFRQAASAVRFRPDNGMRVRLYGSVGLYAKTGSYQFYADGMEQDGLGELYLRFEALKERLMREGLFDASLKKPLPLLPKGIGIITSRTGAVVHDIARVAWRRNPGMPLYLYSVSVQGERAAHEIAQGIHAMDGFVGADVLIVGRGGGSMEDLWPFNEEPVARAIAACHTPVVSAVGHETDFTIADFVSDLRAPTPSAAAELCVPERAALLSALAAQTERMERATLDAFTKAELRLSRLRARLERQSPQNRLQAHIAALEALKMRLENAAERRLTQDGHRLERLTVRLRASGPMETLKRGYALALKDGRPVTGVAGLSGGDRLEIRLSDGKANVNVETIEAGE